jgi:hypothetical protein
MIMAQVSDSTNGIQEAVKSLQPQNSRQSEQATQRSSGQAESNSQSQTRQTEDRVVISQEALTENKETRNAPSGNSQSSRTEAQGNTEVNSRIKETARENKNAEAQLRKFQDQNDNKVRIEPRKVSESVEEVKGQREKAASAKETIFETPSQRVIQEDGSSQTRQARSSENNVRSGGAESSQKAPSQASVQTETGQNVDDVI